MGNVIILMCVILLLVKGLILATLDFFPLIRRNEGSLLLQYVM